MQLKSVLIISFLFLIKNGHAQKSVDTVVMLSNFMLQTPTGTIAASLSTESTKAAQPLVIIVAGSGPTDRNGNNLAGVFSNSYKILADSLLQHGIATLRYDKRGIAKSASALKKEIDLRFDDYVNDLNLFVDSLRKLNRFSSITIAGHSEGALIGLLSAINKKVDKYISIAGPGFSIQATLKKQLANQPDSVKQQMYAYLDTLSKGKLLSYVPKQYHSLFRPSVQPYMINWMQYHPTKEIKKFKGPILIVNGTTDIQVSVADAKALKAANKKAKLVIIENMSHILKYGPADFNANAATYTKSKNEPIDATLVSEIVRFVKN